MNSNVVVLYNYATEVVMKAQDQKKPEWALNEKEKRALRHITAVFNNSQGGIQ